ncbi:MAG: hypothetical protein GC168_16650 [Candidatus Hydrogenedens sp.]|nr:hypothetical protein [Candidatus Hydrogenedens sp.]
MPEPQAQPKPPRRRWPRRLAFGGVLLLAAGGGLWSQSELLLELGIAAVVPADIDASGVSPGLHTTVDTLQVRDIEDPDAPPLAAAKNISVQLSTGSRHVTSVAIGKLALNVLENPDRNFDFVSHLASQPSSGFDATPYLPEKVSIVKLPLRVETPALSLQLDGLSVDAEIENADNVKARVHGDTVSGAWSAPGTDLGLQEVKGSLDAAARYTPESVEGLFVAQVQGLASGRGEFVYWTPEHFKFEVQHLILESSLWSELAQPWLPVETRFTRFEVAEASGKFKDDERHFEAGGQVLGLEVGPLGAPWYAGPAGLKLKGDYGETLRLGGAIMLIDGASAAMDATLLEDGFEATVHANDWSRMALRSFFPPAEGPPPLDYLPKLEAAGWSATLTQHDALHVVGEVSPRLRDAKDAFGLTFGASQEDGGAWLATLTGKHEDHEDWNASLRYPDTGIWETSVTTDALEPRVWLAAWTATDPTSWLDATATGTVSLKALDGRAFAEHAIDWKGTLSRLGPLVSSAPLPYALTAKGYLNNEAPTAYPLDVTLGIDGIGKVSIEGGKADTTEGNLPLKADFDLERLAGLLGLSGFGAQTSGKATLRYANDTYTLGKLALDLAEFWHGSIAMPAGEIIQLAGEVNYSAKSGETTGSLTADWKDKTHATLGAFAFDTASGTVTADTFTLDSDLALLQAFGYVDSGDATLKVNGSNIRYDDTGQRGTGDLVMTGGIVLPDNALALSGMTLEIYANLENGGTAAGPFSAGDAVAFGAIFRNLTAQVRAEGTETYFEKARADLWNGEVLANGEVNLLKSSLPLRFDAEVSGIDLAAFSTAFALPYGPVTGIVGGHIRAAIENSRIIELDADLESTEGFTMSREMVVQAMMSQNDAEVSGSRVISSVVASVIGDAPQRPFDRARIRLGLNAGGRITGTAELNSKHLNLTVDISADQGALIEAMEAAQEGKVGTLSFQ